MKTITAIDNALATPSTDLNATVVRAYKKSLANEQDTIDFEDVIAPSEAAEIVKALQSYNITEFTISDNHSGLLTLLEAFTLAGAKVAGMVTIKAGDRGGFGQDAMTAIPAMKMSLC